MGKFDAFDVLVVKPGAIGWLLWLVSFFTIGLIIWNYMRVRRAVILPLGIREQLQQMLEGKQYREAIEVTAQQPDMLSAVVHGALTEAANGYSAMERAIEESADYRSSKLLRNVEWLNLVGNVSPMLGLLGTVWGMILAFFSIPPDKPVSPGDVATPIAIALVTTLLGLVVAIPSLSAYAMFRSRVDELTNEVVLACEEMISKFRPGKKAMVGAAAGA